MEVVSSCLRVVVEKKGKESIGWATRPDIETLRSKGIGNILNLMTKQSSDADMQKTYTDEHHHQD